MNHYIIVGWRRNPDNTHQMVYFDGYDWRDHLYEARIYCTKGDDLHPVQRNWLEEEPDIEKILKMEVKFGRTEAYHE